VQKSAVLLLPWQQFSFKPPQLFPPFVHPPVVHVPGAAPHVVPCPRHTPCTQHAPLAPPSASGQLLF
jgi:hypothetical protein